MEYSFISPKSVEHEVNGKALDFYPLSMSLLFELRNLAKPVLESLHTLFSSRERDTPSSVIRADGPEGGMRQELGAVSPELAAQRTTEQERAVGRIVEALCDQRNQTVLCKIVLDSIRPREDELPTQKDAEKLQAALDLPTMVSMLVGVVKANAGVFGDLGERIALAAQKVLEKAAGEGAAADSSLSPETAGEA